MLDWIAMEAADIGANLLSQVATKKALERAHTGGLYDEVGPGMYNHSPDIEKLRQASGITNTPITPHTIPELGGNNYFVNLKPDASDIEKAALGARPTDKHVILMNPKAGPEALAHELGHAQIQRGDAGRASKFNQNKLVAVSQKGANIPAFMASTLVDDPMAAMAVGLGTQLLTDSPQLINEFQANRRAITNLDRAGLRKPGAMGRIAGLYATYPMASIAKGLGAAAWGYGARQAYDFMTGADKQQQA